MNEFTPWRMAARGLWGHRRAHAPVAAGVAVATAVLVGALVVGESVRGSLRGLVTERLGDIEWAVAPGRLFGEGLADRADAAPLLLTPASLASAGAGPARRASGATLVGCDRRLFALDPRGEAPWPDPDAGIVLTEALGEELGVRAGDTVLLRAAVAGALPADSPLGERSDTVASTRARVAAVVAAEGLARFGLAPSQGAVRNVFAPLEMAQRLVDAEGRCNTLVAAHPIDAEPTLADYGLRLEELRPGVWQLESRELVLPEAVVRAAERAWGDLPLASANTYLANTIRLGKKSIPYSTVAGIDGDAALAAGDPVGEGEVALTRWAADALGAGLGDKVTLTFYEPESTHGVLREAPPVALRLTKIVELEGPDGAPTRANDRRWTPALDGVTDAESINDWDLPFELVEPIGRADEDYWDRYNTTPKAFVSVATARRLWGSRWGDTSLLRVAAEGPAADSLAPRLLAELDPADFGFTPRAIRAEGLAAASGSTPFDVLFLMFSGFLIASAMLLIVLLTWLAIDSRRRELGLLAALGFDRAAVRRSLLRELAPVAAIGATVGGAAGVAYAALLLWLLRTVWVAAIGAPFLRLHAGPLPVVAGAVAAWLVAVLTIGWAVRRATQQPPRELLGGDSLADAQRTAPTRVVSLSAGAALVAGAAALAGTRLTGEAAAGAFFAAGGASLAALVGVLALVARGRAHHGSALSLGSLAVAGAARRPGRAALTIGLVGGAAFLVLATAAFRLPPTNAGTGGFDLVATSDQPLLYDLGSADGRFELGFGSREEDALAGASVLGFRVQPGEDASCQNLYQATQPRVLGVSRAFIDAMPGRETPFAWAAHDGPAGNPWEVLARGADAGGAVPVVLDFNTAVYSLKLYGGVGSELTLRDAVGEPFRVRVAGLLKNSVLQGDLLMGEGDFLRRFPASAGERFFLIDSPRPADAAAAAENVLADFGFDAASADLRLADFLAVQNTYLSTFQALGGLGLALGGIGLAVAQFRNLLERRGELALLRAGGFAAARLRRLVLWENLLLLGCGLGVGVLATVATLAPLALRGDAQPPWLAAAALAGATLVIGLAAGRVAAGRALAGPITAALRGE